MINKKNINPLGEPYDDGSFSFIQPELEECYISLINSSFFALGRNITLHLVPERTLDVSGVQAVNETALHYNPLLGRAARPAPNIISTTRQPSVIHTHRDVIYIAHIKHGPKEADEKGGIPLLTDEVQTTTLFESLSHLDECESATIDGSRYVLDSKRPIGFQNVRYIISKWKKIN